MGADVSYVKASGCFTAVAGNGKLHYVDKTVLQLSCIYNGNPNTRTWKDSLYIENGP